MDKDLMYTISDIEHVWQGDFLKVDAVHLDLPNGHHSTHEVVRHPGATAIVVLDDDGRVLLERQYRTPIDALTWEIPAGKIDPGEDPETCARRELEEETGLVADKLEYLTSVAVALGYSDEVIHLYLARDLVQGTRCLDEDEFLDLAWKPFQDVVEEVVQGNIRDSKTIIGILLTERVLRQSDLGDVG